VPIQAQHRDGRDSTEVGDEAAGDPSADSGAGPGGTRGRPEKSRRRWFRRLWRQRAPGPGQSAGVLIGIDAEGPDRFASAAEFPKPPS